MGKLFSNIMKCDVTSCTTVFAYGIKFNICRVKIAAKDNLTSHIIPLSDLFNAITKCWTKFVS